MSERPYEILGNRTAPMRGRSKVVKTLRGHLTKSTPDHVSVIGPKHIGKTVLLKHLAEIMRGEGTPYLTSIYWDLRHGAPSTDAEFRTKLAQEIAAVLVPIRADLQDDAPDYEWTSTVLGILDDEGQRVLVILDGLDRVLAAPGITRNLWDNLLALAEKPSLRLVTGSRRRLREICAGEDSRTSDFWEIFHDPPLTLGPLDAADWDDVLRPIADKRTIEASAAKEIANWTGGVPLLAAALALRLFEGTGPVTKAGVDAAAEQILADSSLLDGLWDDCEEELKGDLVALAREPLPLSQIPAGRKTVLIGRGYAVESGNQLKAACRLIERYADTKGAGVSDLRRLFADPGDYVRNARALLELRLGQIQGGNADLRGAVEKAVRELDPRDPLACFVWFRSVAERALKAVWAAEAPGGKLPATWAPALAGSSFTFPGDGSVPRGPAPQCRLLDLITGTPSVHPLAKYVTKPSFILLDALKGAGDFGQHPEGVAVSLPTAVSYCLCAIELLAALAQELPR